MKRLTLIRHASAQPSSAQQADWHRELEARGVRDAQRMAERLHDEGSKPDLLLVSPAVRARTTAQYFADALGVKPAAMREDERLYLAAPKVILEVVRELGGSHRHIMLVGHNPGICEFADQLSGERRIDNMPTCAVVDMHVDLSNWGELSWGLGIELRFDYPQKF